MAPTMSQTTRSQKGDPSDLAMLAGVRKMPTAMDSPATAAVAEARPSSLRNAFFPEAAGATVAALAIGYWALVIKSNAPSTIGRSRAAANDCTSSRNLNERMIGRNNAKAVEVNSETSHRLLRSSSPPFLLSRCKFVCKFESYSFQIIDPPLCFPIIAALCGKNSRAHSRFARGDVFNSTVVATEDKWGDV